MIIVQLNINSLRNKFEFLLEIVNDNVDILLIVETKLDISYHMNQFRIQGFQHFRLDRSSKGGGLIMYIRDTIPANQLTQHQIPKDFEAIIIEINLWKVKWLLCGSYNPKENTISYHLDNISKVLDYYIYKYDNLLLLGDYNCKETNNIMDKFHCTYNLKNLVTKPTCYKNPDNPRTIDLFLTNKRKSFYHTDAIVTGLSDFHTLVITVLKSSYVKVIPKVITYRCFKYFCENDFRFDLSCALNNIESADITYETFQSIYIRTLDIHAPFKIKYVRGNDQQFMNKDMRKTIMNRTKLKNMYYKHPTEENMRKFKKQRNFCVKLLRETKKSFYSNLDARQITDNRKFWKNIKPLFSTKTINASNIIFFLIMIKL